MLSTLDWAALTSTRSPSTVRSWPSESSDTCNDVLRLETDAPLSPRFVSPDNYMGSMRIDVSQDVA